MVFFSIIIPSYNRCIQLEATLASILKQTFTNFEVIVVDDGSTDDTGPMVSSFQNDTIQYFRTENQERALARNFGLTKAQGVYVNYFDSDDIMYPKRLQQVYEFITRNNNPPVLFTHYDFIDRSGKVLEPMKRFYSSFTKDILFNNFLSTGSVFLHRSVALQYPFHIDRRILTAEDWEIWLRLHTYFNFMECKTRTFGIVQHPGRSLVEISPNQVSERDEYFAELVAANAVMIEKYSQHEINLFRADRFTFIALSQSLVQNKQLAFQFLRKALRCSPLVIIRKRFWAVALKIIQPNLW
jgi:glycosyltransferase involved in cell wall biosynthesis